MLNAQIRSSFFFDVAREHYVETSCLPHMIVFQPTLLRLRARVSCNKRKKRNHFYSHRTTNRHHWNRVMGLSLCGSSTSCCVHCLPRVENYWARKTRLCVVLYIVAIQMTDSHSMLSDVWECVECVRITMNIQFRANS